MTEIISRDEAKAKGLTHYFTGKPCKLGHIKERYVSTRGCKQCIYDYSKRNSIENHDKVRESRKRWEDLNIEKRRDYEKQYRAAHRDDARQRQAKYREKNRDKDRAYSARYKTNMPPGFISTILGIPINQLTPDLYALKRQQIELYRLNKRLTNELKEISK